MRTLTLLRHAKSSWTEVETGDRPLADKLRPLAPRGERDAPRMGAWLAMQGVCPDLVLCSTAVRTRQTYELVASAVAPLGVPVSFRDDLYLASADDLLALVRSFDALTTKGATPVRHVLLIGHDPGFHDLARQLCGQGNAAELAALKIKFPTAGAAVIDFAVERWQQIEAGRGTLRHFMTPKRLPERTP
jgi:phosphohistidine phosphatase